MMPVRCWPAGGGTVPDWPLSDSLKSADNWANHNHDAGALDATFDTGGAAFTEAGGSWAITKYLHADSAPSANHEAQCYIQPTAASGNILGGPVVRSDATGANCYALIAVGNTGLGLTQWQLRSYVSGSASIIAYGSISVSGALRLRLTANGSNLVAIVDSSEAYNDTNTDVTSGSAVGFMVGATTGCSGVASLWQAANVGGIS